MKVNVTKEKVIIERLSQINENEINVNTCEFQLPECFEGLTVTAIFNNIPVPVSDGKCVIPNLKKGTAILGVYAYTEENGEVKVMYSPSPTSFSVDKGSFTEDVVDEAIPEITQFETYCQTLQESFDNAINRVLGTITEASALVGGA